MKPTVPVILFEFVFCSLFEYEIAFVITCLNMKLPATLFKVVCLIICLNVIKVIQVHIIVNVVYMVLIILLSTHMAAAGIPSY